MRRLLLAVLLLCSWAAFAQELRTTLTTQIKQLRAAAAAQPAGDEMWKDQKGDVDSLLNRAEAAVSAGRLYLGLDLVGYAGRALHSFENTRQQGTFQAAFDRDRLTLVSLDAKAHKRDWSNTPAAVRALAESAQGQTLTLVDASKAYAEVTSRESGLYYLGEAKADAEFASWLHGLGLKRSGTAFGARDIAAEIDTLQEKVTAAFQPPASINNHRDFIHLNSTLKLARELDGAGLHYGAVYQYMVALQQFGAMNEAAPTAEQQAKLREELAASRAKFTKSKQDDSLALMFVERAEEKLTSEKPSEAEVKAAAAIVQNVLPSYAALKNSPAPTRSKPPSDVVLTLVRWPYT
jgi:hypothetical protein